MPARSYPLPPNEEDRLAALEASHLLTDAPNARFDRLVRLASELTNAPIALVTLLDAQLQHLAAAEGLPRTPMPREDAFCNYTILQDDVFVVEDAANDPRFADNPLVTGDLHMRFYAGAPLYAADGHALGALCVIGPQPRTLDAKGRQILRDLAATASEEIKNRKLLQEYAATMAERDGLVRALAHDLRSPLGGIAGLAELLGELMPAGSEEAEFVTAIREAAQTALKTASATLERATESHPQAQAAVDLATLVQDILRVHQPAAVAKGQRILVEGTPALTSGDPVRLHHALANLVSNALKFSPPASTVTVRTGADADQAWVTVEDEGPGLGDGDPERLFDPFVRGTARPTAGESSTGLGLSIVRDLARQHHGDVHAESRPPSGARFTLSLPARAPHPTGRT